MPPDPGLGRRFCIDDHQSLLEERDAPTARPDCACQLVRWHCARIAPILEAAERHHPQCRLGSLVSAARFRLLPLQAFDIFFVCAGSATNRREKFLAVASSRPIQQSSTLRQEFRRRRLEATHSAVAAAPQCRRPERTGRSAGPVDLLPSTHGDRRLPGRICSRSAVIWPTSKLPEPRTTLPRVQHGAASGSPISAATPAPTRR